MRDYWLTQEILGGIGLLYLGMTAIALTLAVWLPKRWWTKMAAVAVVLSVVSILPRQAREEAASQQVATDNLKQRYAKAQVLFDERCKTAGEKIYRTIENVEGVLVKPRNDDVNYDQQFKLDDPYGYAGKGDSYLKLFVRGRSTVPTKVGESIDSSKVVSYRFVEVAGESANSYFRYTTPMSRGESEHITRNGGGTVPLLKEAVSSPKADYEIIWDDISTREDRENWIAGSSLKIINRQTKELLAERVGYMFDSGLGNQAGGRAPWSAARSNACPALDEKAFYFFDRVIQPTKGN